MKSLPTTAVPRLVPPPQQLEIKRAPARKGAKENLDERQVKKKKKRMMMRWKNS
jgi:hypothetical protein